MLLARDAGETLSEGGFKPGKVVAASLLDVATAKDKSGVNYYKYDILTRTGAPSPRGEPLDLSLLRFYFSSSSSISAVF